MKKWKKQALIDDELYDVVEHTDNECEKPKKDNKHLAPASHGFVCLYQNKVYQKWCGIEYARRRIVQ